MSVIKYYLKALLARIEEKIEEKIGEYQGGFRRGRSTAEQILPLTNITNVAKIGNKELYLQ